VTAATDGDRLGRLLAGRTLGPAHLARVEVALQAHRCLGGIMDQHPLVSLHGRPDDAQRQQVDVDAELSGHDLLIDLGLKLRPQLVLPLRPLRLVADAKLVYPLVVVRDQAGDVGVHPLQHFALDLLRPLVRPKHGGALCRLGQPKKVVAAKRAVVEPRRGRGVSVDAVQVGAHSALGVDDHLVQLLFTLITRVGEQERAQDVRLN
jgi:hypothetical protein